MSNALNVKNMTERPQPSEQPTYALKPLLVGMFLLIVFIGTLGVIQLRQTRSQSLQQAETNSKALANMLQLTISSMLQKTDLTLIHIVTEVEQQSALGGIRTEKMVSFVEGQFRRVPELDSLRIADANGVVTLGSGSFPTVPVSIADRDYFILLRDHPEVGLIISKPIIGKISKKLVVTCARRITLANGEFGGIAYAVLPLQQFNDIFNGVLVGNRGTIKFCRDDLTIITGKLPQPPGTKEGIASSVHVSETWRALLEQGGKESGTYTADSELDGVRRIYSYSRVSPFPLYVNVGLALDDVLKEARQEVAVFSAAFSVFLLMTGGLLWLVNSNWQKTLGAENELKRNYERLKLISEVSQHHAVSVQELLDFTLEKVIALTESSIGYIYNYSEEERRFELNSWSKGVMDSCRVAEPQLLYELDKTGIWGEVIRQRTAIIVNDFASPNPLKKGYPEGHVPLSRFLSIPLFEGEKIVAVVGVSNKVLPYEQSDVLQLSLMMEAVWKIAGRLKLEEQIVHSGHEWQSTFDSIGDSISLIDANQRIIRCNRATRTMLGREFGEIINQPCWKLFHNADAPIADCPMEKAKHSGHSEISTIKYGDGWLEVSVDPIISDKGVLTGAVHIVRNVTERVNLNKSLQDVNELFRLFMRYSPIYTFIKEVTPTESRVIQASDNFIDMVGISSSEMVGKTMHQLFSADFADKISAEDLRVVEEQNIIRIEEQLQGNNYITYKFPIEKTDGSKLLAGYTIDISDLKRAQSELEQQSAVMAGVLESSDAAVFSVDDSYRYTSFNSAHARIMKALYNADIQLGDSIVDFMTVKDANIARANLDRALSGETFTVEADSGAAELERTVFEINHNPIINAGGVVTGVAIFARNISARKQTEETIREMQAQMMQNDKLATIGQLAAGVAHEINNPMGFVGSNMATLSKYIDKYNRYIQLIESELCELSAGSLPFHIQELRQSLKLDYVMRDISVLVEESNEGIDRIKRIVQDLRTFSRADSSAVGSADLNSCMDSTINIVINEIKYAAELKREYGNIPKVSCNAQQINQVFMNLLINAAHAIQAKGDDVGEIVVRTWDDNGSVYVSVADNGCGIAPENCSKIFDAFFTTKEIGKGTGLGLSISSGIIRKHGGEITLSSDVGVGSVFTIRLPLHSPVQNVDKGRK